jgi:peptide/nickel transport system substrate-binding protein
MRRFLFAALAVLAFAIAAGSTRAQTSTLRIGLREDADSLDPTLGSSYVGRIVYAAMCDKLFDLDARLNIVPQLATGWRYEDPTHLVIALRPGVTFHDGEKFDAEAVKYTLTRDLTLKGSMRAGEISPIQSIEVIDPLTVRLVLKAPASPLLAQLADRAGIMISPKAAEALGPAGFGSHPVCAGPYAFESRTAQDRIVLRRFPAHWNAAAFHFDQVVYLPVVNSTARLANLRAGAIDLVEYVLPTDISQVESDPKLKLAIDDSLGYVGITLNTGNGPAANTALGQNAVVRRAFELSIDRAALIQVVYNGVFTPSAQANPASSPSYVPGIDPPARDVAKARELLKQAGVALPVPVVLSASNSPDIQQVAEVIQSMAAEAGFEVKIRTLEFASSLQAAYQGDFQAYLIGWSGRSDADGNMWQMLHTGGTFNYGKYSNPDVDRLLDEARIYADPAKRRDIYRQVWEQERKDLPLVYLWIARNIVGMKKSLVGFEQVPDGLIRLQGLRLEN